MIKLLVSISLREWGIIRKHPIYWFCLGVFPVVVILLFTSLMSEGQPTALPVGIVDHDHTAVSRGLVRKLDAFQNSKVVAHYTSVAEARKAVQENDIYAFLYIPKGMTEEMMALRQPSLSFYYSNVTLLAGSTLFKDLKTVCTLLTANVGATKLAAMGKTPREIEQFLQPIVVDLHMIGNPWANYNVYLSTIMVPGLLMLFIMLLTPSVVGTEMKFGTVDQWLEAAKQRVGVAVAGKLLPYTLVFLLVFYGYEWYILRVLHFPAQGGVVAAACVGLLAVLAAQGLGLFMFAVMPSLRMSMSMCSLWAMLGFSLCGATYPVFAMDSMIEGIAQLFPLRHYYMVYQMAVFNGYPLSYCWMNVVALLLFAFLPWVVFRPLKHALRNYVYTP